MLVENLTAFPSYISYEKYEKMKPSPCRYQESTRIKLSTYNIEKMTVTCWTTEKHSQIHYRETNYIGEAENIKSVNLYLQTLSDRTKNGRGLMHICSVFSAFLYFHVTTQYFLRTQNKKHQCWRAHSIKHGGGKYELTRVLWI